MNTEAQQGLSLSYEKLGDVSSRLGDSTEAPAYYGQSRDIRESLVAADLNRGTARRELAVSYDKLGDVSLEMGSPLEATEFYQQAFYIRENLAAIDPADTQSQRDLCISYDKLGDASLALRLADLRSGDDESAATAGQIPGDVYQRSLAKFTAAIALARLGRREDATAMLATATRIFEENVPDPAGPKLAAYHPERWIVWCQLELMRREAQAALEGVDGE